MSSHFDIILKFRVECTYRFKDVNFEDLSFRYDGQFSGSNKFILVVCYLKEYLKCLNAFSGSVPFPIIITYRWFEQDCKISIDKIVG